MEIPDIHNAKFKLVISERYSGNGDIVQKSQEILELNIGGAAVQVFRHHSFGPPIGDNPHLLSDVFHYSVTVRMVGRMRRNYINNKTGTSRFDLDDCNAILLDLIEEFDTLENIWEKIE